MKEIITFIPNSVFAETSALYPTPSSKTIPKWYKNMPGYFNGDKLRVDDGVTNSTVKHCSPFLDAMTAGYTAVLNMDVIIRWENGSPRFNWRGERGMISFHAYEQSQNLPVPEGYFPQVCKFENDITIKTPKGWSTFFTHPSNMFDLPFKIINGFVDTDRYDLPVQFPFFIQKNWEGIIEKGTPIVQLIPVKRADWKFEIKKHNEKDYIKSSYRFFSVINRAYKTNYWVKKIYQSKGKNVN